VHRALAAFTIALAVGLVATPALRRVALSSGFVDRPSGRKTHGRSVPYLGGISLALSTLLALLVVPGVRTQMAVLASAAVLLGVVGLVDDDRSLGVATRVAAQLAVAAIAVGLGVRAHPTGIEAYDVALTLVWIVGITNAFNLLDNVDGLAAGVAIATALGIVVLAASGDQLGDASVAAALVGACGGFLVFNWRPASIFMGDAGALFLGFVLAVGALEVEPAIGAPQSLLVPALLLAVPLLDTVTVVVARLRRRIPVSHGGRDHLSHRLVALGVRRDVAVALLVGAQLVLAGVAVAAGRDVLDARVATACLVVALGALSLATARAPVYDAEVVGTPRSLVVLPLAAVLVSALLSMPAVLAASRARDPLDRARAAVLDAVDLLEDGEGGAASAEFERAARAFADAESRLDGTLTDAGLAVPGVATNLRAARAAVHAGTVLALGGAELAASIDGSALRVEDGTVPIAEVVRIAPHLRDVHTLLRETLGRVRDIDRTLVVGPLATRLDDLQSRLVRAESAAATTERAAELAPRLFGADGGRRYLLAVQDGTEQRATGGVVRSVGVLVARRGVVRLERLRDTSTLAEPTGGAREVSDDFARRYGRFEATSTWLNANLTPDFPTAARVLADLYRRAGGAEVDGVLALDARGLGALLELTGPVAVPGLDEPVDATNVLDVTSRGGGRQLTAVARAVWSALTHRDFEDVSDLLHGLAAAGDGGHLLLWTAARGEQALVRDLGLAGGVPATTGDSLLVVAQNATGTRTDRALERDVAYEVRVAPDLDGRVARVDARVTVTLRNASRARVRTFLSVYSPFALSSATLDGRAAFLESDEELGRRVVSAFVRVPPRGERVLRIELVGTLALDDSCYRLDLLRQPALRASGLAVTVRGRGARLVEERARGVVRTGEGRYAGPLTEPARLAIRLAPTGAAGAVDALARPSAAPCR
jgi:UDP-GlcNAc:undecaprenyl-phosphate GlcNAc-1-phosphate transferase